MGKQFKNRVREQPRGKKLYQNNCQKTVTNIQINQKKKQLNKHQ